MPIFFTGVRAGAFHDWLLYIEKDQVVEGVPTYVDGALYNREKTELKLIATDSTGKDFWKVLHKFKFSPTISNFQHASINYFC